MSAGHVVTQLREGTSGNQQALKELTPLVHAELRQLPATYLRNERGEHTVQPATPVPEACLRLVVSVVRFCRSSSRVGGP